MKKVAIIYSGAKYQGGIEDYLYSLFKYYDKKKIEIILISLGDWPLCDRIKKVKGRVMVLPGGRIRPQTFFGIKNIIKNEGADLVVSQGVVANFYGRIGAKLAKRPHLTAVHSDMPAEYSNSFIQSAYRLSDFLTRSITQKYIVASNYLKKILVAKGIPKDKIEVIYHGVELKVKSKKEKVKSFEQEIVIGSLGRLDKVKGYDNLIKAFSMLGATDARLVIWGEGKERVKLESLAKELKLEERVEMPGYTENAGDAFSEMDIYIQTSLSEGLGLSVIEAMLSRKPVIVTPAGALKEIVSDGQTGIISKSTKPKAIAEAIKRAFDGFEETNDMIDRAEKAAKEKFSVEESINKTIKVFLET